MASVHVYVLQTQGTVRPASPFSAEEDAKRLRKAMKVMNRLAVYSHLTRCTLNMGMLDLAGCSQDIWQIII